MLLIVIFDLLILFLKEEIKLSNLNSIKYEQEKKRENLNENLNKIEHSIKQYLFGAIRNCINLSFKFNLLTYNLFILTKKLVNEANSFELYQRQAESSIENLILIR